MVLPLAHELINLRHRIVGSEAYSLLPTASVSGLRARGIASFLKLTPRETDVCDCLVKGLTVKGTALHLNLAETSVRTLRQRAYRKLNIVSAYELLAMLAKEGIANVS
jgi:DNA-binding NarL/FixJ family response regulator